jgi:hypothetical protein
MSPVTGRRVRFGYILPQGWPTAYPEAYRNIQLWNQLPEDALGALSYKPSSFIEKGLGK